jgi:ubiquinone/menaquinone biosynthesis C-methylase UbiE
MIEAYQYGTKQKLSIRHNLEFFMHERQQHSTPSGDFAAFGASSMPPAVFDGLSEFLRWFRENVKCSGPFAYQDKVLSMLDLQPGHSILDIGSGRGDDLAVFGKLIGPSGRLTGIDHVPEFTIQALKLLVANRLPGDIHVGDIAKALPFLDEEFDRAYAERVFQYLPDPEHTMRESHRVLKPGGRLVVFDSDWDTATIHHPNKNLTREILHLVTDTLFASGQIGRQLRDLAIKVGFKIVNSHAHAISHTPESAEFVLIKPIESLVQRGVLPKETFDDWLSELRTIPRERQSFSLNGVMLCAQKPDR